MVQARNAPRTTLPLYVLVGIVLGGACATTTPAATEQPHMTVSAIAAPLPLESRPLLAIEAEVSRPVEADRASVELSVSFIAPTAQDAAREVATRTGLVTRALDPLPKGALLTTDEIVVKDHYAPRPPKESYYPGPDSSQKVIGKYALVTAHASDLSPADALEVLRRGVEAGANSAKLTLTRSDCDATLKEMRIRAVRTAHDRAVAIASRAGAQIGALYRIKEQDHGTCPVGDATTVTLQVPPSDDGAGRPVWKLPAFDSATLQASLEARVSVLLVYELVTNVTAPTGEAPGEVHLGLVRSGHAESSDVEASVEISVKVNDPDPNIALVRSAQTMNALVQTLRGDGLSNEELRGGAAIVVRNSEVIQVHGEYTRHVKGCVAQSKIWVVTHRFPELGRWIALAASHGATGLSGPSYQLREPDAVTDQALQNATTMAMDDAQLLARAGEQAPRSVTQIRANEGWLSDNDTLRVFMENFGNGSGYGAGAGSFGRGEAGLSLPPDKGVPVIEIHPPVLGMDQSIAVGFALRKAPAAQP